jgi:hypothetical protein
MAEVGIWQPNKQGKIRVGLITFDEHPRHLHAERTVPGFNLQIPAQLGLLSAPDGEPRQALKNLRLIFSVKSASGSMLEVGRLYDEENHSAYVEYHGDPPSGEPQQLDLTWSSTIPALIAIERSREGKQPQLHIELRAEHGYIIECEHWHKHAVNERKRFPVFTALQIIRERTDVTYPTQIWDEMVQKLIAVSQDDPYLMLLPLTPFLTVKKP